MDLSFSNLRRLRYSPVVNTTATSTQLPNILDAFIPGYAFFCKLTRDTFGFDVSNIAFTFLVVFASATSIRYIINTVWSPTVRFCTAAVTVDANDVIHDYILAWAAQHPTLGNARSLHVHSGLESHPKEDSLANGKPPNGQDWSPDVPNVFPQYEIYKGTIWFWYKGRLFKLAREDQDASGTTLQNLSKLTLTVLGRSTQPIKKLITEVIQRQVPQQMHKKGHQK